MSKCFGCGVSKAFKCGVSKGLCYDIGINIALVSFGTKNKNLFLKMRE